MENKYSFVLNNLIFLCMIMMMSCCKHGKSFLNQIFIFISNCVYFTFQHKNNNLQTIILQTKMLFLFSPVKFYPYFACKSENNLELYAYYIMLNIAGTMGTLLVLAC